MGSRHKILVIDDDPEVREAIQGVLSNRFEILIAADGKAGIELAEDAKPDLILLDILMPGMNGIEVCRKVRETPAISRIPILMLTVTTDDELRAEALLAGADDLITKPFRPKEFLARILSKLRGGREPDYRLAPRGVLTCGNLMVDLDKFEATVAGRPISLTVIEMKLLRLFIKNKGSVLEREQILDTVWPNKDVSDRVVDNHILSLRKKLGGFDHEIVSVYGAGYGLKGRSK